MLPAISGLAGVRSVTLSGAGPAVLLILDAQAEEAAVRSAMAEAGGDLLQEVIGVCVCGGAELEEVTLPRC